MVVGAGSESFRTLRSLVERLPVMLAPAWLKTPRSRSPSHDVLRYLIEAACAAEARGRELQIGGAEVLTYGEMLDLMAQALGRAQASAHPRPVADALALLALDRACHPGRCRCGAPADRGPGDGHDGSDRSGGELFDFEPIGFDEALRRAVAEDPDLRRSG